MTAKPTIKPGEKHYTASVVLISEGLPAKTLLIHHRKYDKWMPPGGHQEANENPIQAAIRETEEETGLDITIAIGASVPFDAGAAHIRRPDYFLEESIPVHGKQPEHYHLDQIYVVRVPEQIPRHNPAESHDIRWFTLAETENLPTFDNVHMILRQELSA